MFIQSKLKEIDLAVFSVDLGGKGMKDGVLQEVTLVDHEAYADIDSVQLFTSGLGIIKTTLHLHKHLTDLVRISGEHVQLLFFFQGKPQITSNIAQSRIVLEEGFMHRSYQKNLQLTVEMHPDSEIRYMAILMTKDYFINLLKEEPWSKKDPFFAKVAENRLVEIGSEAILINFRVRDILRDITRSDYKGEDRKYYIELKLKELVFELYIKQSRVPVDSVLQDHVLYEKVNKARTILTKGFIAPPTIKQLAKMVALNELKLKQSFKSAYGVTIRSYIIVLRMNEAYSLLQEDGALVNDVSVKVGYRSVPHFIATFKGYFGFTPKQLGKNSPQAVF